MYITQYSYSSQSLPRSYLKSLIQLGKFSLLISLSNKEGCPTGSTDVGLFFLAAATVRLEIRASGSTLVTRG